MGNISVLDTWECEIIAILIIEKSVYYKDAICIITIITKYYIFFIFSYGLGIKDLEHTKNILFPLSSAFISGSLFSFIPEHEHAAGTGSQNFFIQRKKSREWCTTCFINKKLNYARNEQ